MPLIREIVNAIKTVYDPEIPVNVCDLGLIYAIEIFPLKNIQVIITLTSPSCPAAEQIPKDIEEAIKKLEWVNNVHIEISFDPPYDMKMMSENAKYELGFI